MTMMEIFLLESWYMELHIRMKQSGRMRKAYDDPVMECIHERRSD